ncbi:hypothetical protein SLA2020_220020 [Shorea laevis]
MGDKKLTFFYGGNFIKVPNLEYVGGDKYVPENIDEDKLSYFEIRDIVRDDMKLEFTKLYYRIPEVDLEHGLVEIKSDGDALQIAWHLIEHGSVDIYIHNGPGHILFDAPNVINEVNEDVDLEQLSFDKEELVNELVDVHLMNEELDHVGLEYGNASDIINGGICADVDQRTRDGFYVEIDVLSDRDDEELISAYGNQAQFWRQTHALDPADGIEVPITLDKGKQKVDQEACYRGGYDQYTLSDSGTSIASSEGERDSDYIDSDDPGEYVSNSELELFEADDAVRNKTVSPVYDPSCKIPHFELGMKFENHLQFKKALFHYSTYKGFAPKWLRNAPDKQRVICKAPNCPWYISATLQKRDGSFKVVALVKEHICIKDNKNPMVTTKQLAKHHNQRIKAVPGIRIRELIDFTRIELNALVKKDKMARARRMVHQELEGNYKDEFKVLRGWAKLLLESNPGTSIHFEDVKYPTDPIPDFRRMYVCIAALKHGWLAGCRPIIGIDGCFLKGICQGILLSAVGRDGNEQMYPIAWAVVESENKDSWIWFLRHLKVDINMVDGTGLTIISDQHVVSIFM